MNRGKRMERRAKREEENGKEREERGREGRRDIQKKEEGEERGREEREMKTRRRREIFLTRVHNRGCFRKLSHCQYFQQRDKNLGYEREDVVVIITMRNPLRILGAE